MVTEEALSFTPPWHAVGDADIPAIAIAYGAIALTTIWTLESIAHRLVFGARKEISLSHVAALVAFKGSSWTEICSWLSWHLWPGRTGHKIPDQRLNRHVLSSILMRIILILLEVAILFISVPRSIPVFENQVGSSEIIFLRNHSVEKLDQEIARKEMSACKQDPIQYRGFAPSAVRQICLSGATFVAGSKHISLHRYRNGTELYAIFQAADEHAIVILSARSHLEFKLRHVIRLGAEIGQSLPLALPNRTDESAISSILAQLKFKGLCTNHSVDGPPRTMRILICEPSSTEAIRAADEIPLYLFAMASTRRTFAVLEKGKVENQSTTLRSFPQVGIMKRPRVGIYPALIILAILIALNGITALACGNGDVFFHMLQLSCEVMGAKSTRNPFNAEKKTYIGFLE